MKRKATIHIKGHRIRVQAVSKATRDKVKRLEQAFKSLKEKALER